MKIPSFAKTILHSSAPTLLTALALPPPFNIIASTVVSEIMEKFLPSDEVPVQQNTVGKPVLTPEQVIKVVERNAEDPSFILELRHAEADLKKYEIEAGIRFSELELKDRQRASDFQRDTGIGTRVFDAGMKLVSVALFGMAAVVIGALLLVFTGKNIPQEHSNVAIAAFGLIGTAVGFINGIAANVVSFYWGSSQGSKDKGVEIANTMRSLSEQLGNTASLTPTSVSAPGQLVADKLISPDRAVSPAIPAHYGLLAEIMPKIKISHKHFEDGVSWALTLEGIAVEGAPASGTPGEPTTIRTIWKRYGDICTTYAKHYGVPVELIVATIATESGGNPNARLGEPKLDDESVGLMQTLVKTARSTLGRRDIISDHLLKPELSIEAGTAYIAQQRGSTHFDPPLVAAAYNAGSIRRDSSAANRWKLLCYPTGTGRHIDRYVEYFTDCMRISTEESWGQQKGVPSFAQCFKEEQKEKP